MCVKSLLPSRCESDEPERSHACIATKLRVAPSETVRGMNRTPHYFSDQSAQLAAGANKPGCRTLSNKTEYCQFKEKELRHYLIITLNSIFCNTSFPFSLSHSPIHPRLEFSRPLARPCATTAGICEPQLFCPFGSRTRQQKLALLNAEIFKFPEPIFQHAAA